MACNDITDDAGYISGEKGITFPQGTDLSTTWTWYEEDGVTIIPLTGYTAQLEAKDNTLAVVIDLNNGNAGTSVNEPAGQVTMNFSVADTENLTQTVLPYKLFLYDLSGNKTNPVKGVITLT